MSKFQLHYRFAALAAAASILMISSPAAAARMSPRDENTSRTPVVVERVEVPVDDTAAEIVQMQLAAAVAATVAVAATKARLRRRIQRPAGTGVIDITEPHDVGPGRWAGSPASGTITW